MVTSWHNIIWVTWSPPLNPLSACRKSIVGIGIFQDIFFPFSPITSPHLPPSPCYWCRCPQKSADIDSAPVWWDVQCDFQSVPRSRPIGPVDTSPISWTVRNGYNTEGDQHIHRHTQLLYSGILLIKLKYSAIVSFTVGLIGSLSNVMFPLINCTVSCTDLQPSTVSRPSGKNEISHRKRGRENSISSINTTVIATVLTGSSGFFDQNFWAFLDPKRDWRWQDIDINPSSVACFTYNPSPV